MHYMRNGVLVLTAVALTLLVQPGCSGPENRQGDSAPDTKTDKEAGNPIVIIETSEGTIRAELWKDKAPKTVANFLRYVDEGFYDGLVFHRVMRGFMIQGGGYTTDLVKKRPHAPIRNEASPALRNDRGTLAMARTPEVHSATAQFFINHADNDGLNQRNKTQDGFGYCAFGKVTEGMDVVDAIARVRTGARGPFDKNVPIKNIVIKSIRRAK